jgi:hypothetical protein
MMMFLEFMLGAFSVNQLIPRSFETCHDFSCDQLFQHVGFGNNGVRPVVSCGVRVIGVLQNR